MNLLTQFLALFRAEPRTLSSVLRRLRRRGWTGFITALIRLLRGRRGVLATLPRARWRRLSHSQASQAARGKQVEREEPFFH